MTVVIFVEGKTVQSKRPWSEMIILDPHLHLVWITETNAIPGLGPIFTLYYSGDISPKWQDHYVLLLDDNFKLHNFLIHERHEKDSKSNVYLLFHVMLRTLTSVDMSLDPIFQEVGDYLKRKVTQKSLPITLETIFEASKTPGQNHTINPVTVSRRELSDLVRPLDHLSWLLPKPVDFLREHLNLTVKGPEYGLIHVEVEVHYRDLVIRIPVIFIFPVHAK